MRTSATRSTRRWRTTPGRPPTRTLPWRRGSWPRAGLLLHFLPDAAETGGGGPVHHVAVGGEPRAVAGAVPAALGAVPAHDAAEVRAHRRALQQLAFLGAIGGHLVQAALHDRPRAARDLVHRRYVAARHPVGVLAQHVQVLDRVLLGRFR